MNCPLCAKLKREYSAEAEQEAKATLLQRSHPGEHELYERLRQQVEISRQRQAHIADVLDRHLQAEHVPLVANAR